MGSTSSNSKTAPSNKEDYHKFNIKIASLNYGVSDCPFEYSTLPNDVKPNM